MKFSHWPDGVSYPVYINPTPQEIIELVETGFDTLRVCHTEDVLAIASGYGNTHNSVQNAVRQALKIKRWTGRTLILHKDGPVRGQLYWNMEDVSGKYAEPFSEGRNEFDDNHWDLIKDIEANYL